MVANRLIDGCGRQIDHLRLSITEACDLRCNYCRPSDRSDCAPFMRQSPSLSDAQRVSLVRFLHERHGLAQVRITGGEPLIHRGVADLVAAIRRAVPDVTLAMTTNGQRLYHACVELRQAGLDRLNVSLDSLDANTYRDLTGGELACVLRGLDSAEFVGFPPPKINMVVLRGVNDHELEEMAAWGIKHGREVRFLEVMAIGPTARHNKNRFVSTGQTIAALRRRFRLRPLAYGNGETARRYQATDGEHRGVIGFISPVSEPFCGSCRRMRISSDGRLFPCLLSNLSVELGPLLADARSDWEEIARRIGGAVARKPQQGETQAAPMIKLGG